jgi:hypothetical protein
MKTHLRRKGPITLDTYYENFSLHFIMSNLAGAFTRDLPSSKKLSRRPDVSRVFRRLLEFGRVTESIDDQTAIQYCHRNGWIYAEDVLGLEPGPQSYMFSSPLHHAALSWRLQARDNLPQFESAYALSLQVLTNFKPSQIELPIRRVNSGSADLPPEAHYQDEYYRSLLAITYGNVRISPEFASARGAKVAGRIDFFIPGVKWGIENTREGDRLNNHASRFEPDAYHKWLEDGDMTDYVLLDCRTTIPSTSHPSTIYLNIWRLPMLTFFSQICIICITLCLTKGIQKFVCLTTRGSMYGDQEHYKKIIMTMQCCCRPLMPILTSIFTKVSHAPDEGDVIHY